MINLKTTYEVDRNNNKIIVTRSFKAPITEVWKAWTDKDILDLWWAPKPYKAQTKKMEFHEGGQWLYAMIGPEGEPMWATVVYSKILPNNYFEGTDAFCDEHGNINKDFPAMKWQVSFKEVNGGTTVEVLNFFEKIEDLEKIIEMGFQEGFAAAHGNLDEIFEKQFI